MISADISDMRTGNRYAGAPCSIWYYYVTYICIQQRVS